MVTSKGMGLAVPDWPTTFGYNMFLFPFSKWVGGIFFEHTHRLIASTVGFLTIILAIWLWKSETRPWVRNLGYAALGTVILQGVLGGLRVTMLKDEIGIFHACLAQFFLGMLVVIAVALSKTWAQNFRIENARPVARIALLTTAVIYLQLALGATMRHEHRDLAILDFPTTNGAWIPDTSAPALEKLNAWRDARGFSDVNAFQIWLQMAHRFVALLVAAGLIAFCFRLWKNAPQADALRRMSILWCALLFCQVALGAWTIWSNKAADIATAHVAVGASVFAIGVAISTLSLRCGQTSLDSASENAPIVAKMAAT
ncbi:MAG: heme a synthase [Verrucomicrobiota bacterium]